MKKGNLGYSYATIIVTILVIQIILGVYFSSITITTKNNNLTTKNITATTIVDSFLELSETHLKNIDFILDEETLSNVHGFIQQDVNKFNEINDDYKVEVYFNCDDRCGNISNSDYNIVNKEYNRKEVEVSVVVKYNLKDNQDEVKSHMSRLVVLNR